MCRFNLKSCKILIFMALFLMTMINGSSSFAADICTDGLKELNSSQGVIQDKGGIWGYLEKSQSYDQSLLLVYKWTANYKDSSRYLKNYVVKGKSLQQVCIIKSSVYWEIPG